MSESAFRIATRGGGEERRLGLIFAMTISAYEFTI